jgi:hypothetical protein
VKGRIHKAQASKVPFFRNPGFWVVLAGLALIIDMAQRTNFLAVGTRMRYWMEPGKGFVQGLEGWIGTACLFAGAWLYVARSKRDPSD